jgi:hypothetical protein
MDPYESVRYDDFWEQRAVVDFDFNELRHDVEELRHELQAFREEFNARIDKMKGVSIMATKTT